MGDKLSYSRLEIVQYHGPRGERERVIKDMFQDMDLNSLRIRIWGQLRRASTQVETKYERESD